MTTFNRIYQNSSKKNSQPDAKKAAFYANVNRYPEVKVKNSPTIYIADTLQAQIAYLHNEFKATEWSGFLLYEELEGNIKHPESLVIRAHQIFPCDVGNATYTEYDPGDYVISMDETTDFLMKGWKLGHIHTHHNMSCFFSGTDMAELHSNVGNYKDSYYLSLIVNNSNEYCAKVAKLITTEETSKGKFKIGKKWFGKGEKRLVQKMYHADCDIKYDLSEGFLNQIEEITPKYKTTYTQNWGNYGVYGANYTDRWNGNNVESTTTSTSSNSSLNKLETYSALESLETFHTHLLGITIGKEITDKFDPNGVDLYFWTTEEFCDLIVQEKLLTEEFTKKYKKNFDILYEANLGEVLDWNITPTGLLSHICASFNEVETYASVVTKEMKQVIDTMLDTCEDLFLTVKETADDSE